SLTAARLLAFRHGLKEMGYVEGESVAIEFRWAEGHFERLPALAAELAQGGVAVIVTTGLGSALAAKAATSTIPLVFVGAANPVRSRRRPQPAGWQCHGAKRTNLRADGKTTGHCAAAAT